MSRPAAPGIAAEPAAPVQSVDRALSVLEILARREVAGVTEIAAELGVHKSTASRLVSVLERRGFVEQLSDRGKYRLGLGIVRLAGAIPVQRDLAAESRACCQALAAEVGETVNVAILDSDRVLNISESRGPAAVASHNWVGQVTPPHATSSGKVLLAYCRTAEQVRALLRQRPTAYTPHTITGVRLLERELTTVRSRGWASTTEEYELGLNAVAAPVRNHEGAVVAAVSVSGPSYRLTPDAFPAVADRLLRAVEQISRRLGQA